MRNNKMIVAVGVGLFLVASITILFLNSRAVPKNNNNVVTINPGTINNNIVVNPGDSSLVPTGSASTLPESEKDDAPIKDKLDENKVKVAAAHFVENYYNYTTKNASTYFTRLADTVDNKALSDVKKGDPTPAFGIINEGNYLTLAQSIPINFGIIKKISVTENNRKACSVEITTTYTMPVFDTGNESSSSVKNTTTVEEKLYLHFNGNYKIDIISLISSESVK